MSKIIKTKQKRYLDFFRPNENHTILRIPNIKIKYQNPIEDLLVVKDITNDRIVNNNVHDVKFVHHQNYNTKFNDFFKKRF